MSLLENTYFFSLNRHAMGDVSVVTQLTAGSLVLLNYVIHITLITGEFIYG